MVCLFVLRVCYGIGLAVSFFLFSFCFCCIWYFRLVSGVFLGAGFSSGGWVLFWWLCLLVVPVSLCLDFVFVGFMRLCLLGLVGVGLVL